MENNLTQYKLDSVKGNYLSAIRHYQNYKNFSDSIQKDIADKQAAELAVQYETDQKNNELELLNNKDRLQQQAIKQGIFLRNTMIAGSGLLLLLLFVIFNRYRIKQKANKSLQEKQSEINSQNQVLEKMILEERKVTAEKERLLTEKVWLMKEINHRVKNNLQVVMSLLNTQSAYLKDEAALNAIQESRHRVHAISLIHRKLYLSDRQLTVIDMTTYIKEFTEYLADSLDTEHRITFSLFIDPVELDVVQAVPTGLIINEAVTNAVKYAFPRNLQRHKAKISIYMYKTRLGSIELQICDNGIGLPENIDWKCTESLGMTLMQGLTKQLDGKFEVLETNGLTIKITFEPTKRFTNETKNTHC
jgi:two-component sensor histidine kinase